MKQESTTEYKQKKKKNEENFIFLYIIFVRKVRGKIFVRVRENFPI
jgi:hypothetical protein